MCLYVWLKYKFGTKEKAFAAFLMKELNKGCSTIYNNSIYSCLFIIFAFWCIKYKLLYALGYNKHTDNGVNITYTFVVNVLLYHKHGCRTFFCHAPIWKLKIVKLGAFILHMWKGERTVTATVWILLIITLSRTWTCVLHTILLALLKSEYYWLFLVDICVVS